MSGNPEQQKEPKQEENTLTTKKLNSDESGKKIESSKSKIPRFAKPQSWMTKKMGEEKEPNIGWWKTFGISIACYLPTLLTVVVSFWLFKPNSTGLQANQTNQPLTEEQKKQIAEEVNKISIGQQEELRRILANQTAIARDPNSILAKGYIDGQIRQEAEEQAEEAAKEEIDKLKADWKGDLFGQIAFPVIFAIASIFAAFAVKDILTEILKEQERNRIKQELQKELEDYIVPSVVEEKQKQLATDLKSVETYTYWLEHELLNIEITQMINEMNYSPLTHSDLEEFERRIQSAIEKLYYRAKVALDKISSDFKNDDLVYFKEAENKILTAKIKIAGLSQKAQDEILIKLNEKAKTSAEIDKLQPVKESRYQRIDSLFEVQMNLMIATLSRLQENVNPEEKDEIAHLIQSLKVYLFRDRNLESKERQTRFAETIPPSRNIFRDMESKQSE